MADDGSTNISVTPPPTRSQTNMASRAAGSQRISTKAARQRIPQPAAKPPPDMAVFKERRRIGEAASVVIELPESSASVDTQVREAVPEPPRRRNVRIAAQWLLALICVLTGMVTRNSPDPAIVAQPHLAAKAPDGQKISPAEPVRELPDDAGEALTAALDDLDSAIEDFPQRSPEQILRAVSRPGHDCMLAWDTRYPSLIFGRMPIGPNSLAAMLEGCAQAVKQLPR